MNTPPPRTLRRQRGAGGCAALALIGLPLFLGLLYLFLRGLGAFLIVADPLERSHAVIVLSGGGNPRLEEAGRLYKEGFADKLILTETGNKVAGYNQDYSFYETLKILNMDIPPTAVFVTEKHAQNTYAEAVAVLDLMKNNNFRSGIVVTDPYHTRRARMIFRDIFAGSGISIRIWPASNHWYRSTSWFLQPKGWYATLSEYGGLAVYLLGLYRF
ncbi:MAG: YdcF family protein [Anaerolineaceae bacterium]|nr:YdcF family protein [Anaerolineaceae bacterium]